MIRKCEYEKCGIEFDGSPQSHYCPEHRLLLQREAHKRYEQKTATKRQSTNEITICATGKGYLPSKGRIWQGKREIMTVKIVGMEMPKSCSSCRFQWFGMCAATENAKGIFKQNPKRRPSWCPLQEVKE